MTDRQLLTLITILSLAFLAWGAWAVLDGVERISSIPVYETRGEL